MNIDILSSGVADRVLAGCTIGGNYDGLAKMLRRGYTWYMSSEVLPVPFTPSDWERIERFAAARSMSPLSLVMAVVTSWLLLQDDPASGYSAERRRRRWLRGHLSQDVLGVLDGFEADE